MNNPNFYSKSEGIALVSTFAGSSVLFYICYEILYCMYERRIKNKNP